MKISVFVSSTASDLHEHRDEVIRACLNAGFHPVAMEYFLARTEDPVTACMDEIEEADLFIGIYAWRYGFVPADSKFSITEMEFKKATELNKPRFCFLVDEAYPWPDKLKETGLAGRALDDFKSRINHTLVRATFTTPDDLASKVAATLANWVQRGHVPERPVAERVVRLQLQKQSQIQASERDLANLQNRRAYLLNQQPDSMSTQLNQKATIWVFLFVMVLCIIGAATSQSVVLGLAVLIGIGVFVVHQWRERVNVATKLETEIRRVDQQIDEKQRELNRLQQESNQLN